MGVFFRSAVSALAVSLALASGARAAVPAAYPDFPASGGGVDLSQTVSLPELSYGPPASGSLNATNVETSVSLVTGLDLALGYKVDLAGHLAPAVSSNVEGLFLSHPEAGYAALASGGNFVGATAAIADDLHFSVGAASLQRGYTSYLPDAYSALARVGGQSTFYNPRGADSLLAGVSWDVSRWASVGLSASRTTETDGALGFPVAGVDARTDSVGISARLHLGDGWVTTATYSEGVTQLDLKPGALQLASGDSSISSRSYGIVIAKDGLFGNDALGFAVSRPPLGTEGNEFVTMPGAPGGQQFFARNHLLAGTTPETDIEVGYVTTFLDGSLALQTNAAFQMNYAGQSGTNAVSLLSRARIKF